MVFILFVFVLCLVPNVVCVSGLSILDFSFGFLFISLVGTAISAF